MPLTLRGLLRPRSYAGLLAMLVVVIVVSPLLDTIPLGSRVLDVLFALALLSAIRDIAEDERHHHWILAIGAIAVISRVASALAQTHLAWLVLLSIGSTIALFVIAAGSIARHVFRQSRVSVDTIRGAICVYLLLGIIWTLSFAVVVFFDRTAFPALDPVDDPAGVYNSLQYFSFVTLTTLGYGDITPHGLAARQLAVAEAIVGQLYIAVAIAWLVGMYRGADDRPVESPERTAGDDG